MKKKFFTKCEAIYFTSCFAIAYLFPSTLILQVDFVSHYVSWVMEIFPMIDHIATGSSDPDSYRVLYAILVLFMPVVTLFLMKKPSTLREDLIRERKVLAFVMMTFFMPFIVALGILGLMYYDESSSYQPIVITTLMSLGMKNFLYFIFIWGGAVYFVSFIIAGYIHWLKNMKRILFN